MSIMRQKIAEHMVFSKRTSAHVTTVHKVDMTTHRQDARPSEGRIPGAPRLQPDLPAVRDARHHGRAAGITRCVNASIDGTNIIYHRDINLGIAVALENGLIVPVIRNADEKNVVGIAALDRRSGLARPFAPAPAR